MLRLDLFDDVSFTGLVERVEPTFSGGQALSGRLVGVEMGTMALVVNGTVVAGTVRTPGATYRIRPVRPGVHVIREVDPSIRPPGAEPLPPRLPVAGRGAPPEGTAPFPTAGVSADLRQAAADDAATIDVLVVYTPKSRADAGGAAGIETLIDLYIAETNQAYANSGVHQRIRLVHTEGVNYTSDISSGVDLVRIADPNDGYMDDVHALRDTYGADLVHLISHAPVGSGIAYKMAEVSHDFESSAFSVTHSSAGPLAFAHELGHNMGLNHDRHEVRGGREQLRDLSQVGPYPYSFGYVNQRAFDADAPWSTRLAHDHGVRRAMHRRRLRHRPSWCRPKL